MPSLTRRGLLAGAAVAPLLAACNTTTVNELASITSDIATNVATYVSQLPGTVAGEAASIATTISTDAATIASAASSTSSAAATAAQSLVTGIETLISDVGGSSALSGLGTIGQVLQTALTLLPTILSLAGVALASGQAADAKATAAAIAAAIAYQHMLATGSAS